MTANPQQAIQLHTCRRGRCHIETIEGVDDPRDLVATRSCGKQLKQQRGSSRRPRADDFRELPPGHAALKARIEPLDSCGRRCRLEHGACGGQRGIELSGPQGGFDGCQSTIRHTFA